MQVARRLAGLDLDVLADIGLATAGAALTALAAWASVGPVIVGPVWLRALLPLFIGGPLVLRRRAPLVMWIAIWVTMALQDAIAGHPPEGLEWFVPFAGAYSLGALVSLRRSALCVAAGGALIFAARPSLLIPALLAVWLVGVFVRTRSEAASLTASNVLLQHRAEQAAADERTRIARELHDIVAHHLSVIVVQAAGARASGKATQAALEKIENSGRQALTETRRLLGVLRHSTGENTLAPQPGIGELAALVESVRATGVAVNLVVSGSQCAVPAALDVSVYRIVQEALTNVLKHAGHARVEVAVDCADDAVTVDVTNDGPGPPANAPHGIGHGLAGMRERVAIFGGELSAGTRPGGGFSVQARLPLHESLVRGDTAP